MELLLKKENKEFVDELNEALESLESSGEFDKIYNSWFEGILK